MADLRSRHTALFAPPVPLQCGLPYRVGKNSHCGSGARTSPTRVLEVAAAEAWLTSGMPDEDHHAGADRLDAGRLPEEALTSASLVIVTRTLELLP